MFNTIRSYRRQVGVIVLIGLLALFPVYGCSKKSPQSQESSRKKSSEGVNNLPKLTKADLNKSSLEIPEPDFLFDNQKQIFARIQKRDTVKAAIHQMHLYFESGFMGDWFKLYQNPQSQYWLNWEKTGKLSYPGEETFVNETDGQTLINQLEQLKPLITDKALIDDINTTQRLIANAVSRHSIRGLFYAHKVLHDLDYWVINYPISYPYGGPEPPSWSGTETYFGVCETLGEKSPGEINEYFKNKRL